ncbi:MAG: DUF4062 domain-containing protein [Burkholderiales bacterium]|nr:DUF4062 domain-containing protein [Burkholderiales bacterium]
MAAPKIFVSSTCYDLHEVRHNVHKFIKDFGYEPVMSEYGDIFYPPDEHVQDACVKAIDSCNMFVLIIGDKYGSIYHRDKREKENDFTPNSVTLKEFHNALALNIPKAIFINRFVYHDYKNYRRFLDAEYQRYFSVNLVDDADQENKKAKLKYDFDSTYMFPVDSYRYVFFFLDQINELRLGNSYHEFENSEDIQRSLKQQWAGYLEQSLKSFRDKPVVKQDLERRSFEKLEQVEKLITSLAETLKSQNESLNKSLLSDFVNLAEISKLEDVQKVFDECVQNILYQDESNDPFEINLQPRVSFEEIITEDSIKQWVEHLVTLANTHKWSQVISINPLFSEFEYKYWKTRMDVPIKFVMQLASIYEKSEDKQGVIKTLEDKFGKLVDYKGIRNKQAQSDISSDDIPF